MELNLQDYVQDIIKKKITTYHVVVRQHDKVVGRFDWRDNRRDNVQELSEYGYWYGNRRRSAAPG